MTSGLTTGFAGATLRAAGVAAALVCAAGTGMAADNATLKITSFTVSAAEFSGNFAWMVDAYQSFDMTALQAGGLFGNVHNPFSADNWNMGLNHTAQTANAAATGNLVQFTDGATQLMTAGFNLAAQATPGTSVPPLLPNSANASSLLSGAFVLLDGNGAETGGTITFDVYYDMFVSTPPGSDPTSYGQTQINLLSSSDSGESANFADGLVSTSFASGTGMTSGHFTWTYTLTAGQAAYYTLSGSAIGVAAAVPEPGTYALMALGLAGVAALTRRRRRAAAV